MENILLIKFQKGKKKIPTILVIAYYSKSLQKLLQENYSTC